MDAFNALTFREWLRNNTELRESSISLYCRTIAAFFDEFKELSVENINRFVSRSVRSKNCYYMKYAFRFYMEFAGKRYAVMTGEDGKKEKIDLYKMVVKVKAPPRKKLGVYRSEPEVRAIVDAVEPERRRDIATLQFATAARARGIITLHELNIDLGYSPDAIKLRLVEKGRKEQIVYLLRSYEGLLKKYMGNGYLFLPDAANKADPQDVERIISNEYVYYWTAIATAAKELGYERFGTHDFRRNVAEIWRKRNKKTRLISKGMGHGSERITERYFDESAEAAEVRDMMLEHQRDMQ